MTPGSDDTLQTIRRDFPFPWQTQVTTPQPGVMGGLVRMVDATGKEVALFAMTRLAEITTAHMDAQVTPKAA